MIQLLISSFQFMMACQHGVTVVTFDSAKDEVGVYARGYRNDFGTPLIARGRRDVVLARIAREAAKS